VFRKKSPRPAERLCVPWHNEVFPREQWGKLRRPGALTEFIDSRTVEEYIESGEFEETLSRHGYDVPDLPPSL
jgi:hypothetical protein